MDPRVWFTIIFTTTCLVEVWSICEYCPVSGCLRLHTDAYVRPSNIVDSVLSSLIGKRTLDLLYSPCYRGCLPSLGHVVRSKGRDYVMVDTSNVYSHQHMWTQVTMARHSRGCISQHSIWMARTTSGQIISTQTPSCNDSSTSCYLYPFDDCMKYSNWAITKCPDRCGLCQDSTTIGTPQTHPPTFQASAQGTEDHACDKITLMLALMHQEQTENQNVEACADRTHTQSEAVLMNYCNATSTTTWSKGQNVMTNCSSVPMYSPVATFYSSRYYHTSRSFSGVFVGCIPNGFKIVSQKCGGHLEVITVGAGTIIDANHYFVVLW